MVGAMTRHACAEEIISNSRPQFQESNFNGRIFFKLVSGMYAYEHVVAFVKRKTKRRTSSDEWSAQRKPVPTPGRSHKAVSSVEIRLRLSRSEDRKTS